MAKTFKAPDSGPASTGPRVLARRPLKYDGRSFDRDQIFHLTGQPNDERLGRLGYVAPFDGTPHPCNECGALFASTGALEGHGAARHRPNAATRPVLEPQQPGESDFDYDQRRMAFERQVVAQEEADERRADEALERDRPLNWENTRASRDAEI